MKRFTEADARAYVAQHIEDIMRGLEESRGCAIPIPEWARKSNSFRDCWQAGCWLNVMLKQMGASEREIHDIGFCMGQRSAFGNAWKWAVEYANQYAEAAGIKDVPGNALADRITNETFARIGVKRECN